MRFPLVIKSRLGAVAKVARPLQMLLPLCLALGSANTLQAALTLTTTAAGSPPILNCNTLTGPGTAIPILVKVTGTISGNVAITVPTPAAGTVITPPTLATLSSANNTAGITFTLSARAACAGATAGTNTVSFNFAENGTSSNAFTFSYVVTATSSSLNTSVTSIALTCILDTGVYTVGPSQAFNVISSLTSVQGGTPFTVDTSASGSVGAAAAWATVTPRVGTLTANSTTPVAMTVVPTAGCGGFAANTTNTTTITLLNAPAPARVVNVTLRVLPPSPLLLTPATAALTYVKGSGTAGRVDVNVTASTGAPFFTVDTTSLPIWLTVDSINGSAPRTLRFSSTTVADTLAAGTYTATVRLRVSNFGDRTLSVSLAVNNPPARLTLSEGSVRTINWVVGSANPTLTITAVSSDSPIPYTVTTSGRLAPIVAPSQQSGLAYSFGTAIPVTFDPLIFAAAVPGTTLTGVVSISWGNPSTTTLVTINVNVQSSGATVSGLSPASLPTSNSGVSFTVALTGAGFITGTDPATRTRVGIVSGGAVVNNTNVTYNVVNGSNITLTIIVPNAADSALPFSPTGSGGSVVIGVCNPVNGVCTTPTGTATLTIGNNPIIQAITSASAYQQVTAPTLQTIAPFDMITIFGSNFCTSGGTGCSTSQVLYGAVDPLTLVYPRSVSPDAVSATQRSTSVSFFATGTSTLLGTAPILFATNNQINAMVPAGLSAQIGNNVDVVVNFGYATGATMRSSAPMTVSIVATNPGLFTIGSNGQGDAAVLDANWSVVSATNPAGIRTNVGAVSGGISETVQLYLTGLGSPSTGANNNATGTSGGAVWGTDCISTSSYLTSLNTSSGASVTAIDGAIVQSALLNSNRLVPCIASGSTNSPTVTIGGQSATITYAGFVPDAISGLYQINVKLPINTGTFTNAAGTTPAIVTGPIQLPLVVTANGRTSQSSVNLWVAPRLRVAAPTALTGTVGTAWASSNNLVAATEGTSSYRYAITSGLLPSGLAFNTSSGAISGTPAANTAGTYAITVTATDSASVPVSGTVSFTLTIAGGLFLSPSAAGPYTGTFGTANANLVTVSSAGGIFPYTYTASTTVSGVTSTAPAGLTVSSGGAVGVSATLPAGTYSVVIGSTDTTPTTPLAGSFSFTFTHALGMSYGSLTSPTAAGGGAVTTIGVATGSTGSVTYSMPATTGFTFNAGTRVLSYTGGTLTAGNYNVVINASDGTAPTGASAAAQGTITVPVTIAP
jgi:hypothetical protein